MSKFAKFLIDDLDELIKEEYPVDIFDLPVNPTDIDGKVEPLCGTHNEESGTHSIVKIYSENKDISYIRLQFSDGGILVGRSQETEDLNSLKFKTNEGWSNF